MYLVKGNRLLWELSWKSEPAVYLHCFPPTAWELYGPQHAAWSATGTLCQGDLQRLGEIATASQQKLLTSSERIVGSHCARNGQSLIWTPGKGCVVTGGWRLPCHPPRSRPQCALLLTTPSLSPPLIPASSILASPVTPRAGTGQLAEPQQLRWRPRGCPPTSAEPQGLCLSLGLSHCPPDLSSHKSLGGGTEGLCRLFIATAVSASAGWYVLCLSCPFVASSVS